MAESARNESFEATVQTLYGSQHRGAELDRAAASREDTVLAMGRSVCGSAGSRRLGDKARRVPPGLVCYLRHAYSRRALRESAVDVRASTARD
jgi:hypothetical protein